MVTRTTGQVLIVGLGKTGMSCARFLARRGIGFEVADHAAEPPGLLAFRSEFPETEVHLGAFNVEQFRRAARIIVSPGVPLKEPAIEAARQHGVEVIGDVELFAQEVNAPVIAVTGANGKSTVTCLLGQMFKEAQRVAKLGGNLGTPALDLLFGDIPHCYVLELSSFQLESVFSLHPVAATVLNVSPDHLDRYRDLADYASAKLRIYNNANVCVVNRDDLLTRPPPGGCVRMTGFTLGTPAKGEFGLLSDAKRVWLAKGKERLFPLEQLPMAGLHNAANALAALALGEAAGLSMTAMWRALQRFKGLPHRMEWVARSDGVDWYNDSKGTNVGATLAAISGMPNKVVLIAGGLSKNADFGPLRQALAQHSRAVILIGRDARKIEQAISNSVPVFYAVDMEEAVHRAHSLARPGDSVLLSPACASFDMFGSYEERGRVFATAVQKATA